MWDFLKLLIHIIVHGDPVKYPSHVAILPMLEKLTDEEQTTENIS